jgi:hypothetical protein
MLRIRFVSIIAFTLVLANMPLSFDAKAADDAPSVSKNRIATAGLDCQNVRQCGPTGCNWHRVCRGQCPDGVSCYPLYGAYGPYGGVAYWGSYTDSGWGYPR